MTTFDKSLETSATVARRHLETRAAVAWQLMKELGLTNLQVTLVSKAVNEAEARTAAELRADHLKVEAARVKEVRTLQKALNKANKSLEKANKKLEKYEGHDAFEAGRVSRDSEVLGLQRKVASLERELDYEKEVALTAWRFHEALEGLLR